MPERLWRGIIGLSFACALKLHPAMQRLIFCAFLAIATVAHAQRPFFSASRAGFDPTRLEVLHATTKRFVDEGKHAGIITLLARDGKIADVQAIGYRDVEKKLPMERNTICRVYSMSKIITSVGVLVLLEEGRFNLDDPVAVYLPELKDIKVLTGGTAEAPALEPLKRPITIKHLLTHTSGLIYDFDGDDALHKLYKQADLWSGPDLNNFIRKVGTLPLKHQPGDAYTYAINTDVLGVLIERVSGKSFGEFLAERIFAPLGMKDTAFDVPSEKMSRLAKTYNHGADGKGFVEAESLINTSPAAGQGIQSGGAGIFSTVDDYARFAQMLCNGGTLDGKRILGRKTVELMTANHLVTLPESAGVANRPKGFGLGVEVANDLGRLGTPASPGQFGWYGAATTYCQIDPKEKLVAIAFAQHFPYNQHNFFSKFTTGYFQALK
jgi:CubicO group peptidase (beta-lactamase class C family)